MNRENEIRNIRVDEIIPNRFQPRLAFNQSELKELSDSIKVHGIIQPLVLRRVGDKYEIIAGERRYKASIMAGLTTVPAIIMNIDDKQSAEVAVVENLQRKDLTAIEEAQSYKKILDMGYLTQEELASRMGVAQPTIANKLRLLNLSEAVQQALLKNQISERHARSLLQIPDKSLQVNMLNRIISERMTVRQTDEEISKILGRPISSIVIPETGNNNVPPRPTQIVPPTPAVTEPINKPTENPVVSNINNNQTHGLDINKIKAEAQDIIKEHKPTDIGMLLRTQDPKQENNTLENKKISLEDTAANVDMGSIVKSNVAINPFQEVETEIMNFEIPSKPLENPAINQNIETGKSSLIEEFKQQHPTSYNNSIPTVNIPGERNISKAINAAREEVRKIEQLGFNVDTEEFDFEDMYQIIIKIKKD